MSLFLDNLEKTMLYNRLEFGDDWLRWWFLRLHGRNKTLISNEFLEGNGVVRKRKYGGLGGGSYAR